MAERCLLKIKERLRREAFGGHELLKETGLDVPARLLLAQLILGSAALGSPDEDQVIYVATAVEIMRLAVVLHYEAGPGERNLRLIAADYYYAKAISMASALPSIRTVDALTRAISEIAYAQSEVASGNRAPDPERRAALFAIAGELGGYLAGLDEGRIAQLRRFGRRAGRVHLAAAGVVNEAQSIDEIKDIARSSLNALNGTAGIEYLEDYLARLAVVGGPGA